MTKKLTITIDDEVYAGLYRRIGRRRISRFLESLARPHVLAEDLEAAYRAMAADEVREREAKEWSENLVGDHVDRLYPSEAYVTLQGEQRKAMADQIATVAKERLSTRIGEVTSSDLADVERAVKVQLGL